MPVKKQSIGKVRALFSASTRPNQGNRNTVSEGVVIGKDVEIGHGNTILPGTIIVGDTVIGDDNIIGPYAIIGTPAQHRTYYDSGIDHSKYRITIGSQNVLREFSTIHSPSVRDTVIGDDCFFMAYSHVPHDARIGNGVTLTNGTQIAGHSTIMDYVNVGLNTAIHQYTTVGPYSILGMGSIVTKDIPPFVKYRNFECFGINSIGMQRNGFNERQIKTVNNYYTKGTSLVGKLSTIMKKFENERTKGRALATISIQ